MHKSFILICLAALSLSATARSLSPDEAWQRASSSAMAKAPGKSLTQSAKLVYTATTDQTARLYVFNNNDAEGYVVVSADDAALPVLGYADHGTFDPNNMPENMHWWLEQYALSIAEASNLNVTATAYAPARRANVDPLLKSKWNQGAPYNLQCPEISGQNAVTGCVATAMAQVMYYHKWPAQATGEYNGTDFSQYSFDWDAMTPTYNSSSTEQSKDAVAALMRACGLAVNATYGVNATSAYSINMERAFIENFGYDKDLKYLHRDWYTLTEWEDIVYADLIQGLPVLYDGQSSGGGHQFVCDGYNGGYFHINWGWGGMSDGYFLLSALDPESQGIGGSTSGYNTSQCILTGLQKPKAGSQFSPIIYTKGAFQTSNTTYNRGYNIHFISLNENTTSYFYNATGFTLDVYYGAKFTDAAGAVYYARSSSSVSLIPGNGYSGYSLAINDVPDGIYTVTPAFYYPVTDKWYDTEEVCFTKSVLKANLTSSTATFTIESKGADVEISNFALDTPLYQGKYFKCSASITSDREGLISLRPCVFDLSTSSPMIWGAAATISLQADETQDIEIVSRLTSYYTMPTAGQTYGLALVDDNLNPISKIISVVYEEAPTSALSLSLESLTLESSKSNDIRMHGSVKCVSGYMDSSIMVYLFPAAGGTSLTSFSSPTLFLSEGQSCEFDIAGQYTSGTVGDYYQIIPYINNSLNTAFRLVFTLGEPVEDSNDATNVLTYDFGSPFSASTPTNTVAQNTSGEWHANKIVLADGVQFANPHDFIAAEVEYTRTFQNLEWEALYLPMELTSSDWSAYASRVIEYTGTTEANGETLLTFSTVESGKTLKANHPYIFLPTATGTQTLRLTDTKVYATPETDTCIYPDGADYVLFATYEGKTDMYTTGAYALKSGNFYRAANNDITLKAFRVYLLPATTISHAPAALRIAIDSTEGVSSIINDSYAPGVMYDLSGRRVDNPTPGIYILNGQKILIK